jgi:hypothetical protein
MKTLVSALLVIGLFTTTTTPIPAHRAQVGSA